MLFYDITMTYKATNDKVVVDQDDSRYDTASDIIGAITNNKLGGAYARHNPEVKMSSLQAKTAEEVLATVEKNSYWYDGKDIKVRADSEFFAECFDNKVLGYGVEETRDVFTNAFAEFEKTIDQIHKDLPSQAKGLEY